MHDEGRPRAGDPGSQHVTWVRSDVHRMALLSGIADLVVSALGPFQDTDAGVREARRLRRPLSDHLRIGDRSA